jgi:hypothetical protein
MRINFQLTEVRRNPRHEPSNPKSLGKVIEYYFNGQDLRSSPTSLSLRNDSLVYGKKTFPLSRMTCLLVRINGDEKQL